MVPHGMAVSLTAPEAFRFTFEASPERHVRAAELLAPDADRPRRPRLPADRAGDLMRDIDIPNGIGAVGYDEGDIRDWSRARSSSSGCWPPPREDVDRGRPRRHPQRLAGAVVSAHLLTTACSPPLRGAGLAEVDDSGLARALYSSDASLYRVLPRAVVRPRHGDEIVADLEVCRSLGVPLTMRGAGTSIAGNAVGPGVVVDTSRYLTVSGDRPRRRTATVEPASCSRRCRRCAAARAAVRPRPEHAQPVHRRRHDRQQRLRFPGAGLRPHGQRRRPGRRHRLRRKRGWTAPRRRAPSPLSATWSPASWPRSGPSWAGSGGRCRLLARAPPARARLRRSAGAGGQRGNAGADPGATVRLVADAPYRGLVVLGYPTMADAADATPGMLPHSPTAVEGLDARIVQRLRDVPAATVPKLPRGGAWLIVELTGESVAEVAAAAQRVVADSAALDSLVVTHPTSTRRRSGGSVRTAPDSRPHQRGHPAHAGWEDAAVPPERLGEYLREFDALLDGHGLHGVPYGHFGDGCVHVRIDFPFDGPPARAPTARS